MANDYSLGTPGEYYYQKTYYLIFMFFVMAFIFWGMLSVTNEGVRIAMIYYILFGAVLGALPILFDNATLKNFKLFDTVTIEKPRAKILGLKMVAGFTIILVGLTITKIVATQQAFVPYPTFTFFDSPTANAILSGAYGFAENWFFFAFIFPTMFAIASNKLKNTLIGFVISSIGVAVFFMLFHAVVYQARQDALLSTLIFSYMCMATVAMFKNIIPTDAMHFANNFIGRAIQAGVGLFGGS